jgi:hypothetical protein
MPYIDQFERADPLTLNPIGILDLWPRQAIWEARGLLAEARSCADLQAIAADVELMIQNEATRLLRLPRADIVSRLDESHPKAWVWTSDIYSGDSGRVREHHGDTNLYEAAIAPGQSRLPTSVPFEDWEGYAVIALWKLVDFMEILRAPRRQLVQQYSVSLGLESLDEKQRMSRLLDAGVKVTRAQWLTAQRDAAPMLIEAVRACALGAECRLRAAQMAVLRTRAQRDRAWAVERVEMRRRQETSKQARDAANVLHKHLPAHQEKAWQLANSKWFPNVSAAGRYAAARISKSDGKAGGSANPESDDDVYTERTVIEWLKERGWKRVPKPEGEPARKRRKT